MARGPHKQPDAVKALRGNPGRRKLEIQRLVDGKPTAMPPVARIAVPDFLTSPRSRQIFKAAVEDSLQRRVARPPDFVAYGRWSYYFDVWLSVKETLVSPTYTSESKHGTLQRKSSQFTVQLDLERVLQSLEDRLGLNPVARQNIIRGLAAMPAALASLFRDEEPEQKQSDDAEPDSPLGFLQRRTKLN